MTSLRNPKGGAAVTEPLHLDTDKIDAAALALLHLTLHDGVRAWKTLDYDVLARLHEKGLIANPVGVAKSVVFSDEGLRESRRLLVELFGAK